MNEQEPPAKMVKSSEAILPQLAKAMTDKLPGNTEKPGPAKALPEANLVPLGVQFAPKDVLGIKGLSPSATGFYKDGEKRYRTVVATYATPADVTSGVVVGNLEYPGYPAKGASTIDGVKLDDPALRIAFFALRWDQPLGSPWCEDVGRLDEPAVTYCGCVAGHCDWFRVAP